MLSFNKKNKQTPALVASPCWASLSRTSLLAAAITSALLGFTAEAMAADKPNILFIVMDDIGVDQMKVFGYGGATPANTPNIDAIAHAGVRFGNAWTMPTCSPSRATFFQGRYPFRTHVFNAIVSLDLANSQVSPFEVTTPKILKRQGYRNGVFGKMHLSGSNLNPANNPLGDKVMHDLGWDYFTGYLDGGPYPIDTTAGGVAAAGTYQCGFVANKTDDPANGADTGACYRADDSCAELSTATVATPGRACLEKGGIFVPNQACQSPRPGNLDFSKQNGYYTGEWTINTRNGTAQILPASSVKTRGYRTILETDLAVDWIKKQAADQPWMTSVGYSAAHTPLQPPPTALLPAGSKETGAYNCIDTQQQRVLTNQTIEAMDHEIGRLLVETGIAAYKADGSLDYQPKHSNTVVIIVGDNGTYAPSVKAPFNPQRSKGFPYQTGVWVPLIVAGPMVNTPDRSVPHMVNSVDLFQLFGELAGVNVHDVVPKSHTLDAKPMLPYLTKTDASSIRTMNYTEMGTNIATAGVTPPPCVIPAVNSCVQVFPQKGVCEDQGGTWYGANGAAGAEGLSSCCAVNDYLKANGQPEVELLASSQKAIRNKNFKLVQAERFNCASNQTETINEFYRINEAVPVPKLDNANADLLQHEQLTPVQQGNYQALLAELQNLQNTAVNCPGDGNLDLVVNDKDLENWQTFSTSNGGNSSWYDFNLDGLTNEDDRLIIEQNFGKKCKGVGQ